MAQEGYDDLMALTDSRYRLTMMTARRAAQLKTGIPSLLSPEEMPDTTNTVTIAMKEFELGKPLRWGDDLPGTDELSRALRLGGGEERQEYGFGDRQAARSRPAPVEEE